MKIKKKIVSLLLLSIITLNAMSPLIQVINAQSEIAPTTENTEVLDTSIDGINCTLASKDFYNDDCTKTSEQKDFTNPYIDNPPILDNGSQKEPVIISNVEDYNYFITEGHIYDDVEDNVQPYVFIEPQVLDELSKSTDASFPVQKYTNTSVSIPGMEGWSTNYWGEWSIFKIDGVWAFCLEPQNMIVQSTATEQTENQSTYSNLSQNQRNNIQMFSGYGTMLYEQTSNIQYLFATQILIWDAVEPDRWNAAASGTLYNEALEINNYVVKHDVQPIFLKATYQTAPTHTLKWDGNKYSTTLTDTNGVFSYKVGNSWDGNHGDYNFKSNANTLTITTTNDNASDLNGVTTPKYQPTWGESRYFDATQDIMKGNPDPQLFHMNLKIEPALGDIEILKSGENLNETSGDIVDLSGAVFEIRDGNTVVDTLTTNADGYAKSSKILAGNYQLCEVTAPTGYNLLPCQNITIGVGQTLKLDLTDDHIEGGFELIKLGEEYDGNYETLVADFDVYQDINMDGNYDTFIGTYTTDNRGYLKVENLDYGNYRITETNVGDNYWADFETYFDIREDGEVIKLSNQECGYDCVLNKKFYGTISIEEKVGENFENDDTILAPLENTEWTIYNDPNQNGILEPYEENFASVQTMITNADGYAISEPVKAGYYTVKETKTNPGYVLDENTYPVIIDQSTATENYQIYPINEGNQIVNEVIKGQIDLTKVAVSNENPQGVPFENVTFEVYDDVNGDEVLNDDEPLVDKMTTDAQGYAISKELKYGGYLVKEVAQAGYVTNETVYYAFIDEEGEIIHLNDDLPIENTLIENDVTIEKYQTDTDIPIKDTYFQTFKINSINGLKKNFTLEEMKHISVENVKYLLDNYDYEITSDDTQIIITIDYNGNPVTINGVLQETDLITSDNGTVDSAYYPEGTYITREYLPNVAYNNTLEMYAFSINQNNMYEENVAIFNNDIITNNVIIQKTDVATGEEIEGAEICILDRETGKPATITDIVTGEVIKGGCFISKDTATEIEVDYGKYEMCEKKPAEGYDFMPNQQCVTFDVVEDGVNQTFKIDNRAIEVAEIKDTGAINYVLGSVALLIFTVVIFMLKKNKINK